MISLVGCLRRFPIGHMARPGTLAIGKLEFFLANHHRCHDSPMRPWPTFGPLPPFSFDQPNLACPFNLLPCFLVLEWAPYDLRSYAGLLWSPLMLKFLVTGCKGEVMVSRSVCFCITCWYGRHSISVIVFGRTYMLLLMNFKCLLPQ